MKGFLLTGIKDECLGCEACTQVCGHKALTIETDQEGFRYPRLNAGLCTDCGLCHKVCPIENPAAKHTGSQQAYGGYVNDNGDRLSSTSGGAFTAICRSWHPEDAKIFGAVAQGLDVHHIAVEGAGQIGPLRKSKYSQSRMGQVYRECGNALRHGKNVIFSGTPCQIAGLRRWLDVMRVDTATLLTVEVVCEGVPSPLYMRKADEACLRKYGSAIASLDYRHKQPSPLFGDKGKWDFQMMKVTLDNGRTLVRDRWFIPFWRIWLGHLISRPSCYECPFTTRERVADITLGDLWGVHLYCPELYGRNGGASLVVANTAKGREALAGAKTLMHGHDLDMDDALRYQSPMRKPIAMNPQRGECMADLEDPRMTLKDIDRKWGGKISLKILCQKYIWGNRQKVALWNLLHR